MKSLTFAAITLFLISPPGLLADMETDRRIEDAAASSYNFRTVLEKQVTVKAESGVVTLTGVALDQAQKALAEETVRCIPGVVGVNNQLKLVSIGPGRSDGWIALKIRSLLLLRSDVSAKETDVSVRDGNVFLAGSAESVAQKELTESYAREVEGVNSVTNTMIVRASDSVLQVARAASALD
jgi:osmotically-inducible protein OsmY